MKLSLPPKTQRMIETRVKSGNYKTAEDVVVAAMSQLDQQEQLDEFEPGEIDVLLAQGEQSGAPLDGEAVLAEIRSLGRQSKAG